MNDSELRVCLIVTAAGSSTRFGTDKLGEDLGGRPVLIRAVEPFTKRDEVVRIVVAGPPATIEEFRGRFGPTLSFHGAIIVKGSPNSRWETVQAALEHVPGDCTHVAIHDGARPCISEDLLERVFAAARVSDAVVPAVDVVDTVKRVGSDRMAAAEDDALADAILGDAGKQGSQGRLVRETLDREGLVLVQTPQVFRADLLRRAYAQGGLEGATDDASIVERLGAQVLVVEGETRNLKVTTKSDLALARMLSNAKPPATSDRAGHLRF